MQSIVGRRLRVALAVVERRVGRQSRVHHDQAGVGARARFLLEVQLVRLDFDVAATRCVVRPIHRSNFRMGRPVHLVVLDFDISAGRRVVGLLKRFDLGLGVPVHLLILDLDVASAWHIVCLVE